MDKSALTLFGKTRRAILTQAMLNSRRFRLRELARLTGISSGAIQQDLNQLVEGGILERIEEYGQITYQANTRSQIYPELRAIVQKTMGEAVAIRDALENFGEKVKGAYIYGSTASGKAGYGSDIDVLVIGTLSYPELVVALKPVEEMFGKEVNSHLLKPEEFEQKKGSGDRFIMGLLAKPMLVAKGASPQ